MKILFLDFIESHYGQFLGLHNWKYYISFYVDFNTRRATKLTQLKWADLQVELIVAAVYKSWDQEWWIAGHGMIIHLKGSQTPSWIVRDWPT